MAYTPDRSVSVGTASAIGAFLMWGMLPLYWVQISHIPAIEIIGHRIVWGMLVAWAVTVWRGRRQVGGAASGLIPPSGLERTLLIVNGVLLSLNWFVYVWAVSAGRTLEASLGYYINPLVSVIFGMLFFGERLSRLQWAAVGSAAVGVLFLAIRLGVFPWISLTLAVSFALYGVIKKRSTRSSIQGLAIELTLPSIGAVVLIGRGAAAGTGVPFNGDFRAVIFLVGAGIVTVAPLLLFGIAARRIRLSDVGFLQYIAPTIMFLIAVAVFGEQVERSRLVGFVLVWLGLGLYSLSNARARRRSHRAMEGLSQTGGRAERSPAAPSDSRLGKAISGRAK